MSQLACRKCVQMFSSYPLKDSTARQLPIFEGWWVDMRMQQFRATEWGDLTFHEFDSAEGLGLLDRLHAHMLEIEAGRAPRPGDDQ